MLLLKRSMTNAMMTTCLSGSKNIISNTRISHPRPTRRRKRTFPFLMGSVLVMCMVLLQSHFAAVLNEENDLTTPMADAVPAKQKKFGKSPVDSTNDSIRPSSTGLRFDWSNLPLRSPIAKRLKALQQNCSKPVMHYEWRAYGVGMGSDLHAWGNALWSGLNGGYRIRSPKPWLWVDQEHCGSSALFECYFSQAEPACPNEVVNHGRIMIGPCGKSQRWNDNYTIPEFRAAATEFVFASLSPIVVKEAQEQRYSLFGESPTPPNLITIHVRWGDNNLEVRRENTPIQKYVEAIETMIKDNNMKDNIHILLCTEDPVALEAFRKATSTKDWTINVDPFYAKYLPYRKDREIKYNLVSHISMETKGAAGRWALASMLVAMEANYFVLTTKSNWSRLMNELRKNVVDPSCHGCTKMMDIDPGEC